jgi:hypothetical protein
MRGVSNEKGLHSSHVTLLINLSATHRRCARTVRYANDVTGDDCRHQPLSVSMHFDVAFLLCVCVSPINLSQAPTLFLSYSIAHILYI